MACKPVAPCSSFAVGFQPVLVVVCQPAVCVCVCGGWLAINLNAGSTLTHTTIIQHPALAALK